MPDMAAFVFEAAGLGTCRSCPRAPAGPGRGRMLGRPQAAASKVLLHSVWGHGAHRCAWVSQELRRPLAEPAPPAGVPEPAPGARAGTWAPGPCPPRSWRGGGPRSGQAGLCWQIQQRTQIRNARPASTPSSPGRSPRVLGLRAPHAAPGGPAGLARRHRGSLREGTVLSSAGSPHTCPTENCPENGHHGGTPDHTMLPVSSGLPSGLSGPGVPRVRWGQLYTVPRAAQTRGAGLRAPARSLPEATPSGLAPHGCAPACPAGHPSQSAVGPTVRLALRGQAPDLTPGVRAQ